MTPAQSVLCSTVVALLPGPGPGRVQDSSVSDSSSLAEGDPCAAPHHGRQAQGYGAA